MRRLNIVVVLLFALAPIGSAAAAVAAAPSYDYAPVPVAPSLGPDAVKSLLLARPFSLDEPYAYTWSAEHAAIRSGWLLVVEVKPEAAVIKDTWNPVLYVGRYPAEIAGTDADAGRMVVLVPGDVDLAHDPIFFGSAELPERVTAERGAQERAAALAAGYAAVRPEQLRLAEQAGGERVSAHDAGALYAGPVAELIDRYAPKDAGRAEAYRAPRVNVR